MMQPSEALGSSPFLTVFTRACRRPAALLKNIHSVMAQSDLDLEQVFTVDHEERGLDWANAVFHQARHRVKGRYVLMLDDDTFMVGTSFVSRLKEVVREHNNPGVVLFKATSASGPRIVPPPAVWDLDWVGGERPEKWRGHGECLAVRSDLWKKHVRNYKAAAGKTGGDWHFVTSLIESGATFAKMDLLSVSSVRRGRGKLFEECGENWLMPITARFGIERDLVLRPYRMAKRKKILMLTFNDWANVGYRVAQAVNEHGYHEARAICCRGHGFKYPIDIFADSNDEIAKWIEWADVVHVFDDWVERFGDLLGNRRVVVTYNGTYYRRGYKKINARDKELDSVQLCTTLDLEAYGARWMPVPMREMGMRRERGDKWCVVHAPTSMGRKGTEHVISQMAKLPGVTLDIVSGVSNRECLQRKRKADIYLDNFGPVKPGYGVNSLEAWRMGIPVVSNVSAEIQNAMLGKIGYLPFVVASPHKIAFAVRRLMREPKLYNEFAERGSRFVRDFHSSRTVVSMLIEMYGRVL